MSTQVNASTSARAAPRGRSRSRDNVVGLKSEDGDQVFSLIEDPTSTSDDTIPDADGDTRHRSFGSSNEPEFETPEPHNEHTQVAASSVRRQDPIPTTKLPSHGFVTPRKPKQSAPVTPASRHGQTPTSVPSSRKRTASSRSPEESPTRRIRREKRLASSTPSGSFQHPDNIFFSPGPSSQSSFGTFATSFDEDRFPLREFVDLTQQEDLEEKEGGEVEVVEVGEEEEQENGSDEWKSLHEYVAITKATGKELGEVLPHYGPPCRKCGEKSYRRRAKRDPKNAGRYWYECEDTGPGRCNAFVIWGDLQDVGPIPNRPGSLCGCKKYFRKGEIQGDLIYECAERKCTRVHRPN